MLSSMSEFLGSFAFFLFLAAQALAVIAVHNLHKKPAPAELAEECSSKESAPAMCTENLIR